MGRLSTTLKIFGIVVLSLLAVAATSPGSITRSVIAQRNREEIETHHHYIAPGPEDSRSPCPALNVLANHGYLPRDGRNIGYFDIVSALQEAYGIDFPLSTFLAVGGFGLVHANTIDVNDFPALFPSPSNEPKTFWQKVMTGFDHETKPSTLRQRAEDISSWAKNWIQYRTMELHHIGLHNHIEHDASITHDDAPSGDVYAPWASNHSLFEDFMRDSTAGEDGNHVDLRDLGTARVRREQESLAWSGRTIDPIHANIALGESALVIAIFGESLPETPAHIKHDGDDWHWDFLAVPKHVMRTFWLEERLPENWRPRRITNAKNIGSGKERVQNRMKELRGGLKESVKQLANNATAPIVAAAQKVLGSS